MSADVPAEGSPEGTAAPADGWATPSAPLCIEGAMTVQRAVELRDALIGALAQPASTLEVDLSGVNELDTAGVQLLLLAKRTATARDKELHLVGQSPAVVNVFETLNLTQYFGTPAFFLFSMEEAS
jgi:anti-anti-sigma factor